MKQRQRWAVLFIAAVILTVGAARSVSGLLIDMADHWSAPLIAALEAKGIVTGDLQGRFLPDAPLTRAQMARLMVSALGHEAEAQLLVDYPSRYGDIAARHWAKGYVESLAESAITEGYPDGTFGPEDTVTRAQMAVFLARAAGLAEQARLRNFEPSQFTDDREMPEWARGSIAVALSIGLMNGFDDNSFRPLQPITRAEGGATLLRLLNFKGAAYHLTGTLLHFDPQSRQGAVHDALGQERAFTMAPDAEYYRAGYQVAPFQVQPLDQVWIVLGPTGTGRFLDARYEDLFATRATVAGRTLQVPLSGQMTRSLAIQPGALLYLNGRPALPEQLTGQLRVYAALDRITGEVRVLDAVQVSLQATFGGVNESGTTLIVVAEDEVLNLPLAAGAVLSINGEPGGLGDLVPGDRLLLARNSEGQVIYVQAER